MKVHGTPSTMSRYQGYATTSVLLALMHTGASLQQSRVWRYGRRSVLQLSQLFNQLE
jgi:hypothetical protein